MNQLLKRPLILGMDLVELALALVAITMPFGNNLNSYAIVFFSFVAILRTSFKEKANYLSHNKLSWILPVAYFVLIGLSYLWDKSPQKSFKYLETGASLFVFPLVLGSMGQVRRESLKKILLVFVLTNMVAAFYCLWKAYLGYQETHYFPHFFYHYLSRHIDISAIYFSSYCVFSVAILYYYYFIEKSNIVAQVLAFIGIMVMTMFTILLSSKMFIFILYITGLGICMYSFFKIRHNRWRPLVIALLLLAMPILLLRLPYVYSRITETQLKQYGGVQDDQNGFAVRRLLWEESWKLIKEHPFTGMGYYYAHDNLREQYREAGFDEGVKLNYNSHNQYLFTWLCYGIVGILLLLSFLLQFLLTAYRKKEFLGVYIMLMLMVSMLTDCMLEIQKGIVLLMLFAGVFVFNVGSSKTKDAFA